MQLYAITDRHRVRAPLPRLVDAWSSGGVHFIQLREKDLDLAALVALTRELTAHIDRARAKLLVNISGPSSAAAVLDAGADGVHLAGKPMPGAAQRVRDQHPDAIVSLPCHTIDEIAIARAERADLLLFSPVFEKFTSEQFFRQAHPAHGLDGLRQACAAAQGTPVFALGGVTTANASTCIDAGAAGVAAIRLFAEAAWRRLAPAV